MATELQKALGEAKPTLVEMYRLGDEACEEMNSVVAEIRKSLGGRANVLQIDGSANQDIMRQYNVASYPAWLLFKDGAVAWRDYGRKSYGELEHMVRDFI